MHYAAHDKHRNTDIAENQKLHFNKMVQKIHQKFLKTFFQLTISETIHKYF